MMFVNDINKHTFSYQALTYQSQCKLVQRNISLFLEKIIKKEGTYPITKLLSSVPTLVKIYQDYNGWIQLKKNLDEVYNQGDGSLETIILVCDGLMDDSHG